MKINTIKRPGESKGQRRYNPDSRYQSASWKKAKKAHKLGYTQMPDGFMLSNTLCYNCYPKLTPMHTVDHHVRVKDGADFWDTSNYRSLCKSCHARKSAKEAQL